MPEFHGWPADATAFLAEIAADNTREFWDRNRDRHAAAVHAPTVALAAELEPEFGPVRVFRPYVNRRFRPDAPPYRTDTGGVARTAGGSALAVVLSVTALAVTAGHWAFDGGQLRRYRDAVAGPAGEDLVAVFAGLGLDPTAALAESVRRPNGPVPDGSVQDGSTPDGSVANGSVPNGLVPDGLVPDGLVPDGLVSAASEPFGGLMLDPGRPLTGTPRGFRADHPRIALLRYRGLQVRWSWPVGEWLATREPLERVRAAWRMATPVLEWLDTHVGPADPVPLPPRPAPQTAAL